jgi:L-alanine-DL-glutamate epimerase-like enolase superfamily enzyme
MRFTRRNFLQAALAAPIGTSLAQYNALAAPGRGMVKITSVKAARFKGAGLIKIETDAGITGYGPFSGAGSEARSAIAYLERGGVGLVGEDPLSIDVHFHNMFYAHPQRSRPIRILSGIDIALWDLAGKILQQPVSKLLGGNFRDELELYSHCYSGNPRPRADILSKEAWRVEAETLKSDRRGFKTFKVDIHHALNVPSGRYASTIGPKEARRVHQVYTLAREALGEDIDIIVHCHNELDEPSAVRVAEAVEHIEPLFLEDPLAPDFSEAWMAVRRSTRIPLMTGENIELVEMALPFLQQQAVDYLQPDLVNSGGITGTKRIADLAALYRVPVCLHSPGDLALTMASQQWSAAIFNCPMMECGRWVDESPLAASNAPVIKNGRMKVSTLPGIGLDLDQDYLRANLAAGESWWG